MRPVLIAASFAAAATLVMPAFADDTAGKPGTISIQGVGEVVSAPDTASVTTGVATLGKTAREALTANTTAVAALISALKGFNIDAKDIQTSGFSVNPQYVYPEKDATGAVPPPVIAGYQVQNGVNVTVRKLPDLGKILDGIVSVGANTINGVTFTVDDPSKLLDEARKAAFADAEAKAKIYTTAAGVGLGRIVSIAENPPDNAPRPMAMKAMAFANDAAPVPVEAGQLTYDVNVAVEWELNAPAN